MKAEVIQGEAIETMRGMADNSFALIATDPPYFKVKNSAWDRQWDSPEKFIEWIGLLCQEWQRVLKPNGSLYVFASPKMASRVEVKIGEHFNILNHISWRKHDGTYNEGGLWSRANKEQLRRFFEQKESIIFAERHGFIFAPLRDYLLSELAAANTTPAALRETLGYDSNLAHNWFAVSGSQGAINCWTLPTKAEYARLQKATGRFQREHEDLRLEYESLRRPFLVAPDVAHTDVWDFPTVQSHIGKHECEKPFALIEHIVRTSSREGDVVLDCFAGSGVIGEVCAHLKRDFVGIELSEWWANKARRRIERVAQMETSADIPKRVGREIDTPLFNL